MGRKKTQAAEPTADSYEDFIARKSAVKRFDSVPQRLPIAEHLFPHQRDLVGWALKRGRAALFTDTGTGKTAMQLEFARHASQEGRVLILAPLAVTEQTSEEAARFGMTVPYRRKDEGDAITVANYDMLDAFDPSKFTAIVLDESSCLKDFSGALRNQIIESFRSTPFRLACSATPSPNDYTELGSHSEFLGIKSRTEMLSEFFTHNGEETQKWSLRGHAEEVFWRWVCTWAAMLRRPSDLGYDDAGYDLPPLTMHEHVIGVDHTDAAKVGMLLMPDARTLSQQRATRRATLDKRVVKAAELAAGNDPVIVWCELNPEGDALEKAIDGAVQVKGSDPHEKKIEKLRSFLRGEKRVLVSKPSICGAGVNMQHCNRMVFVGASHSFEQTYQATRRVWRYGQTRPVDVHVIRAETEGAIVANYRRKEEDARRMVDEMVLRLRDSLRADVGAAKREWTDYAPKVKMIKPDWMRGAA